MSKQENYEANRRANQAFNEIIDSDPESEFMCLWCHTQNEREWIIENAFKCPDCNNDYA